MLQKWEKQHQLRSKMTKGETLNCDTAELESGQSHTRDQTDRVCVCVCVFHVKARRKAFVLGVQTTRPLRHPHVNTHTHVNTHICGTRTCAACRGDTPSKAKPANNRLLQHDKQFQQLHPARLRCCRLVHSCLFPWRPMKSNRLGGERGGEEEDGSLYGAFKEQHLSVQLCTEGLSVCEMHSGAFAGFSVWTLVEDVSAVLLFHSGTTSRTSDGPPRHQH